ncbi:hypothetical protein BDV25DRAFT_7527 [Aspergillus avenaceus]|uniref:Uncharacterized protein n=1 Tax=Aspergillus avenaceus TaxID=36643 RepID=A0A5N6TRZ4_ASPAV|nr:hypothetical protein BDV25DRAFT_7527 [Aspergillus avenaceus]
MRQIHLTTTRTASTQRSHFGIYISSPPPADPEPEPTQNRNPGTLINVLGTPMHGYALVFTRNYTPDQNTTTVPLGTIPSSYILDPIPGEKGDDNTPRDELQRIAASVKPPGPSKDFLGPVNGVRTILLSLSFLESVCPVEAEFTGNGVDYEPTMPIMDDGVCESPSRKKHTRE